MTRLRSAIALALLVALSAACKRAVLIDSEPTGAVVRVNGQPRGTTHFRTQLEYTAFSSFEISLEKEGYRPATARLPMELDAGALICGATGCLPLLLWVQQPSNTVFVLERATSVEPPAATPAPTPDETSGASPKATPYPPQ